MQKKIRNLLLLAVAAVLVLREAGLFDLSLGTVRIDSSTTSTFAPGELPERAYSMIRVGVFDPGQADPRFEVDPTGSVLWFVTLDEPRFSGLDWLPLYKRLKFEVTARGGKIKGGTMDGLPLVGRPEDGAPHGFYSSSEGVATAIGFHSRRSLREEVLENAKRSLEDYLIDNLISLKPAREE